VTAVSAAATAVMRAAGPGPQWEIYAGVHDWIEKHAG
jgi:hypothetical protein